jgi:hypothetical protein
MSFSGKNMKKGNRKMGEKAKRKRKDNGKSESIIVK